MRNDEKYYPGSRFNPPQQGLPGLKEKQGVYDIPSDALQDMAARGVVPFTVISKNLATASISPLNTTSGYTPPTKGDWIEIAQPGNHIVIFGNDGTANQAVTTTAFMEVWLGPGMPSNDTVGFPLKHNRGISGPFERCWVRWPAQAAVFANIVIYRYAYRPWISGESAT